MNTDYQPIASRLVPLPAWVMGVVGGAVGGVSLALPWYSAFGFNLSAFDAAFGAWGGALILSAGGLALIPFAGRTYWVQAIVSVPLGALGALFVVIRIVTESDFLDVGPFVALGGGALAISGGVWGLARSTARSQGSDLSGLEPAVAEMPAPMERHGSEGMSIAALVLGIVGVVLSWFPFLGTLLALLATVFGAISNPQGSPKGRAGLILGIIGLVLSVAFIVVYIVAGDSFS